MMLERSNIVLSNEPCLIMTSFQQQLYPVQLLHQFSMFATHILKVSIAHFLVSHMINSSVYVYEWDFSCYINLIYSFQSRVMLSTRFYLLTFSFIIATLIFILRTASIFHLILKNHIKSGEKTAKHQFRKDELDQKEAKKTLIYA